MKSVRFICSVMSFLGVFVQVNMAQALQTYPGKTIVIYITKKPEVAPDQVAHTFYWSALHELRRDRLVAFRDAKIEVLRENSRGGIRGIAVKQANKIRTSEGIRKLKQDEGLVQRAKQLGVTVDPETAEYNHPDSPALDFVVTIQVSNEVTAEQADAVGRFKNSLQSVADVSASVSKTHMIYNHNNQLPGEKDRMAFLVPWKPNHDARATQADWLSRHGSLAKTLLGQIRNSSSLIKSYSQVHTDLEQPHSVFDKTYQGICFEHVASITKMMWARVTDPQVANTSEILALDEETISQGPSFLFMKVEDWGDPLQAN